MSLSCGQQKISFSGEGKGGQDLLFAKGSVVTTLTTDENGKAWSEKNKKQPAGNGMDFRSALIRWNR